MPTLTLKKLPYEPDSAALMTCLHALPGAIFLDSGGSSHPEGRFDILSALPTATVSQKRGRVDICASEGASGLWAGETSEALAGLRSLGGSDLDVFTAVQRALEAYDPAAGAAGELGERLGISLHLPLHLPPHLPFKGGALGCFGYDAALPADRLKATGAVRESPEAWIGIYLWAVIVDHQRRETIFFALPGCPSKTLARVQKTLETWQAADCAANRSTQFRLATPFRSNFRRAGYEAAFNQVREHIFSGDCYQVNLAQRFSASFQGDPFGAYLALRRATRSPFSAWLRTDGENAVLSFSPERFLQARPEAGSGSGLAVSTQPIKGTRPRGSTVDEDRRLSRELENSAKDRAENLMIVDLLRNDLGRVCETGSVRAGKLFDLQSFNNVHHLVSTISGRLSEASPGSSLGLLRACFPGGSITGAPKLKAMEIIRRLEPDPRQIYCGTVFCLSFDGKLDSSIAIRTLLCSLDRIHCWAGGGLVADSVCAEEYQECQDKIGLLIRCLEDISGLSHQAE